MGAEFDQAALTALHTTAIRCVGAGTVCGPKARDSIPADLRRGTPYSAT